MYYFGLQRIYMLIKVNAYTVEYALMQHNILLKAIFN